MGRLLLTAAIAMAVLSVASPAPVAADAPVSQKVFQKALARITSLGNIRHHQRELQKIADRNGGTRASGTPGFDKSADYVAKVLKRAGLKVTRQEFEFPFFQETGTPEFERISPSPKVYSSESDPVDFSTMQYSGGGEVTALIQPTNDIVIPPGPTPSTSNSGCEATDFPAATAGKIALIQRGTCFFIDKVLNAQAAGAIGVIIFNEGQPGRTDGDGGTLGEPVTIPVIFTTFAIGAEFYSQFQQGPVEARIAVSALSEVRTTENVFGETWTGSKNHVVVIGAHLDSVIEGPGINDNGSGTAVILDIAQRGLRLPRNKLRFAFWGAEESGLLGSEHYAANLSDEELGKIMLNLNFDMMGSPNFVRFVYDGDGSLDPSDPDAAGPPGSDKIEEVFLNFFDFRGLQTEPTAFDGRSDYGPFIDRDIPAGGLFSGAEVLKTAEEAAIYGGTAGVAYDFCYHQACDTFDNNNNTGLKQLAQGAGFSVLWWSFDRLPPREPVTTVSLRSAASASSASDYQGPWLQK
jgi:Zn-dependent M28 family amino/carboxypeptidase